MYLHTRKWEVYVENVPVPEKLIDWYISTGENHIWIWTLHILFNRRLGHDGQQADGAPGERL